MKPRILVTRASFPEVLARLAGPFEVEDNQADAPFLPDELCARPAGKDGTPFFLLDEEGW